MVLAGVATYHIYEKCFLDKPCVYPRDKVRPVIDIPDISGSGKSCLEKEKNRSGEDEMRSGGWIFLVISWGLILGLSAFCFVKVFSKKEIK